MDITLGLDVRRSPTSSDLTSLDGNGSGAAPASSAADPPPQTIVDAALISILDRVWDNGAMIPLEERRPASTATSQRRVHS
jgi:hypothetical protein